jgi:hypothetical protein
MPKEKLFLVKREVMAKNIREAMYKDGKIYSIEEALDQPEDKNKLGFDKEDNKKNYGRI